MFGWRKNKVMPDENNIYAPVQGRAIDLATVADPVFASKMMGDGFAIEPQGSAIAAPVTGRVTMLQGHAVGITRQDGLEVLLHLGIDTVQLDGRPFKLHLELDQKVSGGEIIGEADWAMVEQANVLKTTLVLFTNVKEATNQFERGQVETGQAIGQVVFKG